ncbi:MAG: hypothetical protein ABIV63_00775 [Caldimonas sp.]
MSHVPLRIREDHPSFAGHFPGRPLLPGAMLLAEILEAVLADPARVDLVGPEPRLAAVKFLAPVGPGAMLTLDFEATPTALRFEAHLGDRIAASGHFERTRSTAGRSAASIDAIGTAPAGPERKPRP